MHLIKMGKEIKMQILESILIETRDNKVNINKRHRYYDRLIVDSQRPP